MLAAAAVAAGRRAVFARVLLCGCSAVLVAAALLALCASSAAKDRTAVALISIIIDDLGNNTQQGRRAVHLPGPVACAILPHTPFATALAQEAYENGKEIILHLPMQSADAAEQPGPGALYLNMSFAEITTTLESDLRTVPHAVGVSNHMGSLLTQQSGPMRSLMQALARPGGLFFVDSRTTAATVAATTATEFGVPNLERNVFLDDDKSIDAIAHQFARLIALAQEHGGALAVGHPYPETLTFLETRLPELKGSAVLLVAPSVLLQHMEDAHRERTSTQRADEQTVR